MRIISKYKDFYDSAQSVGIDKSIVYDRKIKSGALEKPNNFETTINDIRFYSYGSIVFNHKGPTWNVKSKYSNEIYLIGFCGKLILAYNFLQIEDDEVIDSKTFYNPKDVLKFYQELTVKYKDENPLCFRGWGHISPPTLGELEKSFEQNIYNQNFDNWFHHFKVPIFATLLDANRRHECLSIKLRNEECYIIQNPCLKDLEFYRFKDTFSCFQEIQQYISGVLTNTEIDQSKMTDKEKINSHGFDMKYGFRTRPKNK